MTRPVGWGNKEIGAEEKPAPKKTKAKAKKRAKKKPAAPEPEEDLFTDLDDEDPRKTRGKPQKTRVEQVADAIGVSVRNECPVCRSVEKCDCTEEDRSFVRRARHEGGVGDESVPRCTRCKAPLSVLHMPRPDYDPPYESLAQFVSAWGCLPCLSPTLSTVAMAAWLKI